jgi:hypothetical protein
VNDDGADHRVRRRLSPPLTGERKGSPHEVLIRCYHPSRAPTEK